jgi:hypothetical protein
MKPTDLIFTIFDALMATVAATITFPFTRRWEWRDIYDELRDDG